MNFPYAFLHYGMYFRIVSEKLNQSSDTVDIGLIGILAVAADNFVLELADGFIAIERNLAYIFFESGVKSLEQELKKFGYLFVFEGGKDEF